MTNEEDQAQLPAPSAARNAPADDGRREAMLKLGKGIAYAAPLTIGLLKFDKATAAT